MKKLSKALILAIVSIMIFGAFTVSASDPYETYTYSIDGDPLKSPPAYSVYGVIDSKDMDIGRFSSDPTLGKVSDFVTDVEKDEDGNILRADVYVVDEVKNRVVILDRRYKAKGVISSYTDEFGRTQTLKNPGGVFVLKQKDTAELEAGVNPDLAPTRTFIYICDTGNARVVVFKINDLGEYTYVRTIGKPDSPLVTDEAFKPASIAVDKYGRIYVVSRSCYEGVIVMDSEGGFTGFIGVQKVTYSLFDMILRRFQSKEQRASAAKNLPDPYHSITVDADGFVYVTVQPSTSAGKSQQYSSIKSKNAANSPVKKLNSAGAEIMKRNGFFDPSGEVDIRGGQEVSILEDIAVGEEGIWTILDKKRSRTFTYDQNGNLLFAFGDKGDQLGNIASGCAVAVSYHEDDDGQHLLLLDNDPTVGARIIDYQPTDYYHSIVAAIENQNRNKYEDAISCWTEVLTLNNNFDLAYIGIGKAYFNQGEYEKAQEYLAHAYETEYWDKAFAEIRQGIIQKWLLLILVVAIVAIVLVVKFLGYAKKRNKAVSLKVGRKSYVEELLYVFHLVFHPFDGFWDLKHEKRGSVRASLTIMILTVVAFFYQAIGQGYSFNPRGDYSTVFIQVFAVAIPVILWCIGNWCLTTLFDGEGSFKDIFVATGYALAPLPIFVIMSTVLTNVMTSQEGSMVSLLVTLGYIWAGILLFFGTMITHGYTMGKNFITILGTIVAMAIIIFVVVLFASLVAKMASFLVAIITEIADRV